LQAESLWDAWAFSVQTIATIGYGQMAPVCRSADVLVFLESITGILFMSVLTGIIFSRFTKTPPRIMFSGAVVCPLLGVLPECVSCTAVSQLYMRRQSCGD
jgi:inward rectifier potassium channel